MIIDFIALLEIVQLGAETVEAIQALIALLDPVEIPQYDDLTQEEKNELLKKCTIIIANLNLNLACFPTGWTTALLFDLEGNPVP